MSACVLAEEYRCKACRAPLFAAARVTHGADDACASYFLDEPMRWMGPLPASGQGKLACPGSGKRPCGAKLGEWSWTGTKCGCGEWVAPAFHVAKSRVDARTRRTAAAAGPAASEALGVSLQWMRLSPPPAVVVFVAHETAAAARRQVERLWGGRFVTDGDMAWLFVDASAPPAVVAALRVEVAERGVAADRIFLGGAGAGAAVALEAAGGRGATFFLAPAPALAAASLAPDALVCAATDDPRPFEAAAGDGVARFSRLEPGVLTHGVVRTFCNWLERRAAAD